MEITAVTQKTFYPGTLVPVHNYLCMCTMLILNIAQDIWDLFNSNSHGRCGGRFFEFFLSTPWKSVLAVTWQNCFKFHRFFRQLLQNHALGWFVVISFAYLYLFSDIKRVQYSILGSKKFLRKKEKQQVNNYKIY